MRKLIRKLWRDARRAFLWAVAFIVLALGGGVLAVYVGIRTASFRDGATTSLCTVGAGILGVLIVGFATDVFVVKDTAEAVEEEGEELVEKLTHHHHDDAAG